MDFHKHIYVCFFCKDKGIYQAYAFVSMCFCLSCKCKLCNDQVYAFLDEFPKVFQLLLLLQRLGHIPNLFFCFIMFLQLLQGQLPRLCFSGMISQRLLAFAALSRARAITHAMHLFHDAFASPARAITKSMLLSIPLCTITDAVSFSYHAGGREMQEKQLVEGYLSSCRHSAAGWKQAEGREDSQCTGWLSRCWAVAV